MLLTGSNLGANAFFLMVYFLMFSRTRCIVVYKNNHSRLNPTGPVHKQFVVDCLLEIADKQFLPPQRILSVTSIYNLTSPAAEIQNAVMYELNKQMKWSIQTVGNVSKENDEISQFNEEASHALPSVEYYMIVVDTFENFQITFMRLKSRKNFRQDAVFVIFLSLSGNATNNTELKDLMDVLILHQTTKSLVLVPAKELIKIAIHGIKLYDKSTVCGKDAHPVQLATCTRGKPSTSLNFFEKNYTKLNLNNCTMPVITVDYPPYVIDPEENTGFEIKLLNEIGNILNISFSYEEETKSSNWGVKEANGSWSGRLNTVMVNNTIGIGNIVPETGMEQDFLLTIPYFFEHMIWVVPTAQRAPRWKCIIVIFTEDMWLATFASFVVAAFLFFVFAIAEKEEQSFRSLGAAFTMSLRVLISSSVATQPYTKMMRTLFLVFAVYGLLLSCLYQSALTTTLTRPLYEHQMHTVQEMVDSRIGIGGIKEFREIFNGSDDPNWSYIYDIYEIYDITNDTYYDWLKTVSLDRDTCTVSSQFYVQYLISIGDKGIVDNDGIPMVYIMNEVVVVYPIRMVLPKSFPFLDEFNRAIGKIMGAGFINCWNMEIKETIKKAQAKQKSIMQGSNEEVCISLDHLQGAFAVLIVGYMCGTVALIVEIIVSRIMASKRYRKLKVYLAKFIEELIVQINNKKRGKNARIVNATPEKNRKSYKTKKK